MRTIEDNKLIAEFIGYQSEAKNSIGAKLLDNVYHWDTNKKLYYYIQGDWHAEDYLLFHIDWNWLIPVVIKCKERQFFGSNSLITRLNNALVQADIELVYEQVIEFINYYNKQDENNRN